MSSQLPSQDNSVIVQAQPGPQQFMLSCPAFEIFFGGSRGGGKGQPLDAKVLTPFGWKMMGELKIGSLICNPDGSVAHVIAIHPLGMRDIYTVSFSDGTSCEVTDDHLWLAWITNHSRKRHNVHTSGEESAKIYTTSDIKDAIADNVKRHPQRRFAIPTSKPAAFNNNRAKLPPYILGALLGDGSLSKFSVTICSMDDEIIAKLVALDSQKAFNLPHRKKSGLWVMGVSKKTHPNPKTGQAKYNNIYYTLTTTGLIGTDSYTKFIPKGFLYSSVENRKELLRGLLDTDGTVSKTGEVTYSTSSEQLAKDVAELARSLGGIVTSSSCIPTYTHKGEKLKGKRSWKLRMKFLDAADMFSLSRKKVRCRPPQSMGKYITSITLTRKTEAQCITVDNPNGLYITNDYIVTHNSYSLILDWIAHETKYGKHAHGVIFRRAMSDFIELHAICRRFLEPLGWVYKTQKSIWLAPSGARLLFRYLEHDKDVDSLKGWSMSWVGIDEAPDWPSVGPIDKIRAIIRSGVPGVVCRYVLTGNPGGPGMEWTKERYIDIAPPYTIFTNKFGFTQCFIQATIKDNPALLENDPMYINRLKASGPPWLVKAWLEGDWDIVMEGVIFTREMFTYGQLPDEIKAALKEGVPATDLFDFVLHSWDTAMKKGADNDYSACTVWGKLGSKYYLLDAWRGKKHFGELKTLIGEFYEKWDAHAILVEDKGSGSSLIQEFMRDPVFPIGLLVPTKPFDRGGGNDKVARARTVTPLFESHTVIFPEEADWLYPYTNELLSFKDGCAHDDWVDSTVYALDYMAHKLRYNSNDNGRKVSSRRSIFGR